MRAHVESEIQQWLRRPSTWGMLAVFEDGSQESGMGGTVMRIGLMLTYLLLLRAPDVFAEESEAFHEPYFLQRGDVAFFRGSRPLERGGENQADKVKVRFEGSKGRQGRRGAMLVRATTGRAGERASEGGRAVELLGEPFEMLKGGKMPEEAPRVISGMALIGRC